MEYFERPHLAVPSSCHLSHCFLRKLGSALLSRTNGATGGFRRERFSYLQIRAAARLRFSSSFPLTPVCNCKEKSLEKRRRMLASE